MLTVANPKAMREISRAALRDGKKIGLVPTMGYLHEGHLSLVRMAKRDCGMVCVSIFVNPIQFGPSEDFSRYPRDMERDENLCAGAGVDYIFAPGVEDMYSEGFQTTVSVEEVSKPLCGASRPGHFDGVSTVVLKLLNIVGPDFAYFGEKDFQQLAVIRRMVADLNVPVEIVGAPIVREKDGLAMSSRNVYLSEEGRASALSLSRSLAEAGRMADAAASAQEVVAKVSSLLAESGVRVDYVSLVNPETLQRAEAPKGALLALAGFVGKTRLIDNRIL